MSKKKKVVVDDDEDVGFWDNDDDDNKAASNADPSGEEVLDEIAAEEAKLDAEEAAIKGSSASRLESEQRMYELNERRRELRERRAARGQSQEEPSSGKSSSRKRKRERTKEEALKDLLERKSKKVKTSRSDELELEGDEDMESDGESRKKKKKSKHKKKRDSDDEAEPAERASQASSASKPKKAKSAESDDEDEGEEAGEDSKEDARLRSQRPVGLGGDSTTPLRLSDLISIQLRRTDLERIMEEPFFEDFIKGKFVRVSIGDRTDGTPAYRVGEVLGIGDLKIRYKFGSRKDYTRCLLVEHGKASRLFAMSIVSNHSFTQEEMDRWTNEMARLKLPVLSAEEALARKREAEFKRQNFVYTPEIVKEQLAKKQQQNGLKYANLALEKIKLHQAREDAKEKQDQERTDALTKQIEELEEFSARKSRRVGAANKLNHSIIAINDKNQKATLAEIDKAAKLARLAALTQSGAEPEADPFSRRRTLPTLGLDDEEAAAAAGGKAAGAGAAAPAAAAPAAAKPAPSASAAAPRSDLAAAAPASSLAASMSLAADSGESKLKHADHHQAFSLVAPVAYHSLVFPAVRVAASPSDKVMEALSRQHDFELTLDMTAQPRRRPVALLPDHPPQNVRALSLREYWEARGDS